jgi:ABC-2 type transport system permease protein
MTLTAPAVGAASTQPREATLHSRSPIPTLVRRRLSLSVRSPRSLVIPVMNPVLFAVVLAPALAHTLTAGPARTAYMTFLSLATVGLLVPLNALFSGIGVLVDRQHGAMRELLVAPIRRSSIIVGNLIAVVATTTLQIVVLILLSALRGANYTDGTRMVWFVGAALAFTVLMSSVAEILAVRLPDAETYSGALPVVAIIPFFFAGSLFPISALPSWLDAVAKVLPLTHALALFRYGMTSKSGTVALHNIWGMHNATTMALLSLLVLLSYTTIAFAGAARLFNKSGTS